MDELSFMNFQVLLQKVINGEISIQEPISIHNKRLDTLSKISFLNHLLNYKNINKDNILEILFKIYHMFQGRINSLKKNDTIQVMLERNNNEWFEPNNLYVIEIPLNDKFFDSSRYVRNKYMKSYEICNDIDKLCKIESNIHFNDDQKTHPLSTHIETGFLDCSETINELKDLLIHIEESLEYLKSFNLYQYMDLSLKHKSLYLKLNEKEDDDIPDNIHIIFSNFIYTHNLILKQMIHYHKHILDVLNTVEEKCDSLQKMKQNIDRIAYMRTSQVNELNEDENDNPFQFLTQTNNDIVIDDNDDDIILEDGLIKTKVNNNDNNGFFSFF